MLNLIRVLFVAAAFVSHIANAKIVDHTLPPIKQIVVFGDSFSDNGNTFRLSKDTLPRSPEYYKGRFSDGFVWAEYFAKRMGVDPSDNKYFKNYAYGHATVVGQVELQSHIGSDEFTFKLPDLVGEVDDYLKTNPQNTTNTLYIFFMGTNDIMQLNLTLQTNQLHFADKIIKAELEQINRLQKLGAKHILLVNIRALHNTPMARRLAVQYAHQHKQHSPLLYLQNLKQLETIFNKKYSAIAAADNHIKLFDAYQFDMNVVAGIKEGGYAYQYENVPYQLKFSKVACNLNNGNYIDNVSTPCKHPQNYFYFDRIHPTTFLHKVMADAVYQLYI